MKKLIALVLVVVCVVGLVGCSQQNGNKDESQNNASVFDVDLNEDVEFEVVADNSEIQLTADGFITNTEKICVSASNLDDESKIEVYLYNGDDIETPIRTATLSANEKSITFTGLSSRFAYRIGASVKDITETITLTITD